MDHSLMNPDHLKSEIKALETELIPEHENLANELHNDYIRVTGYVKYDNYSTLTVDQVRDVFLTLAKFDQQRWRYIRAEKFALRIYKNLLTDRRWIIGSKLRFLKK